MRTVLLVDVHNWYMSCSKKYPGKVVNYAALLESLNCDPFRKIAYGRQSEDKVETFAKALRKLNFEVHFGGGPYNIDMALHVAEMVNDKAVDHLILGTNHLEAASILGYAQKHGVWTATLGFNVPEIFNRLGSVIEVQPDVLLDKYEVPSEIPVSVAQQS